MKKQKIRLLALLLTVIMVVSIVPVFSASAVPFEANTDSLTPVFHLGLSTATVTDSNYTNYYYVG